MPSDRAPERDQDDMTTAQKHPLEKILEDRIAIIDGAMGTTIRTYGMKEADIRGERFKDSTKDLLNNGDLFSLTQPEMICDIHRRFLEAGADIIETNTFGATSITQSEFFVDDPREHGGRKDPEFYQKIIEDPLLSDLAWEINEQSARQCREWADRVANATGRQRFVAGAIGPLTVSLSNSPDADDAGFRVVTFDQVKTAYAEQVRALIAGGVDCCWSRPSSTRSTPRPRWSPSAKSSTQDGKATAGHDLRSRRPRRRDHDLRADHRSLLERGQAREAALRRPQLLARPRPDVSVPRASSREKADVAISCYPNAGLPNPLSRDRLRSRPRRHGPLPRRLRARRPDQHRRRLLRQHARAHRRHRQGARRHSLRADSAASRSQRERSAPRRRSRCASPDRSPSPSSPASTS